MFIFSLFYSDSSQTGGTLTWDMRSGALLLPSWFLSAPVLRFKPLISYRARKIFSISELQQFCALGGFIGHFSPGWCPTTESAKISGDDLSLFWSHHVQYYSFKVALLSCVTDLIFNFFFFSWVLGNAANVVWICAEKRPLGDLPGLSICYIFAHRGVGSVTQVMLSSLTSLKQLSLKSELKITLCS